ncbi:MAG TPA: penicillin-binding transpeptidase domain-containing protein [Candidatus Paceibacterota bacterium]|jgi:penicillin-binding protein 2|nr:penicillin-binding transpeptidase domain-containing protein [Candidatus Paceibacterota bacterium]
MIRRILKNYRKNKRSPLVEPDEIFLDSKNLQNFDRQQFEGRIEKPISQRTIVFLSSFFLATILVFGGRLVYLQASKGDSYFERSENNILEKNILFANRGIIYDRNKKELAWNKKTDLENSENMSLVRSYLSPGFSHLLGYVSYPKQDTTGNYWQEDFIGKDGLEKQYNDRIQGENGSKMIEKTATGEIYSENIVNAPKQGPDLVTTIDSRVQMQLFTFIKNLAESGSFAGGAGIIMDVRNGEIITSTSFPEYNSEVLSLGTDKAEINQYITDKRKFFLDRDISGLYTPGSIVKPFFALGALNEGVIDPSKKILSTGSISIPNPYDKTKETVFKDWRANGWTNMAEAIAVSSDVYFYTIGGGFEGQKGIGIANIGKYAKMFGIGETTGVDLPDEKGGTIPSPEWKLKNFKGDPWRIGDTYHTAIGQYGFQVTPMEMVRADAAIANYGRLLTPHFILGDTAKENQFIAIDLKKEYFDVVHQGMRSAVTTGTATSLNVPYVQVAVKTGTAQLGVAKDRLNSWVMGFYPYENPKYAFVIMMESGPKGSASASSVARELLDWMSINTPEYFK